VGGSSGELVQRRRAHPDHRIPVAHQRSWQTPSRLLGEESCKSDSKEGPGLQSNKSGVTQGDPSATGGSANATGGNGGDANSGNTQIGNGNAVAVSVGGDADASNEVRVFQLNWLGGSDW
jgi:hypothetical protein